MITTIHQVWSITLSDIGLKSNRIVKISTASHFSIMIYVSYLRCLISFCTPIMFWQTRINSSYCLVMGTSQQVNLYAMREIKIFVFY